LAVYTLYKKPTKKKQQSWSLAERLADQYGHHKTPFRNKSGQNFAPNLHLGKWVRLKLALKIEPKEIFIKGEINDGFDSWDISSNVNFWKIDRISGTEPPHLEIGIYRPGSNGVPNSTSTIDFDYININKSDEDWNAVFERKVKTTKYDRTKAGMDMRFKCLADFASANDITDLPANQEIESLIANLEGNDYYRSQRQIVKAGISKEAMDANKEALVRLVNYEGTNEEYCAKPVIVGGVDTAAKYTDEQICAIAKTNGLWNNQYEDERVWVREAKLRGLDCIDSKAFETAAASFSDTKVCDKATAPHGDARKWLADLKSDEAIFHIWREEAERRGLSCNVIKD